MARVGGRDRYLAAALLFVAAALHVVAAFEPEHMEKQLFFTFFWTVVFAQALAGLAILRGGTVVALAIVALNVFLIVAFVGTRFVPVPGEEAPETFEALGVITKAVEAAALPFLIRIARALPRGAPAGRPTEAL